ncbi:MAG TPA: hypothetical protein VFK03_03685, partial [Candidatus Saccharimonadales bacterium]|nr:hypothetical protein [Candidatus Saccharimonadales bacterium]
MSPGLSQFKLQYAKKTAASCSAQSSGSYSDVTATSAAIRYADNPNAMSGLDIAATADDPIHGSDTNVVQAYYEKGTSAFTNTNSISIGQDGMWDFGLVAYHASQNTTYCFRVVDAGGSPLNTYNKYPELNIPAATLTQASYRWYNPEPSGAASTFMKAYGSSSGDYGEDVVKTSDGGYAITGYTNKAGNNDMLLAKYNSAGDLSWSKTWGGAYDDTGYSLVQTSDNGYVITGYTSSYGTGSYDMFLVKYSSSGSLLWSKTWGGINPDYGYSLASTSDGGFVVTGYTLTASASYDTFLAKYDSAGNLAWSKAWGGPSDDFGRSVIQTSDGGYAITGYTLSFGAGGYDMFLVKFNSSGGFSWSKTWGGTNSDSGFDLVQTSDGGYAVTGDSNSFGLNDADMFLAKFDSSGNFSWSKTWGGSDTKGEGGHGDYGKSLIQTSDNGYAITGYTDSFGIGSNDAFLAKYDSSGNLSWSKTWGGSSDEYSLSIVQTSDGGYAATGYTQSYTTGANDIFLVKYDSSGSVSGCGSSICKSDSVGGGTDYSSINLVDGTDYNSTTKVDGVDYTSATVNASASTGKIGYSIGDIGPAGGTVFYIDSDNSYAAFDYMEIAPASWNGGSEPSAQFGCYGV